MAMYSTTLPKIESKLLDFTIIIQDAQFNHCGWYCLTLTLQNSMLTDFSNVKLCKNDSTFTKTREAKTDFTKQEENAPLSFFKDNKFTFRLPYGFCKNERNHEVYLLVEAFTAGDSTSGKLKKVGEGKFAIYPRGNAPRLNRFANPGEDFYNYTDIMGLLRTHSTENIQMHCGRIRSNYSLHEVIIKPPTPPRSPQRTVSQVRTPLPIRSPPPSDRFPSPSPRLTPPRPVARLATSGTQTPSFMMQERRQSPEYSIDDFTAPPSPPLPLAADGKRIPEAPLRDEDKHTFYTDRTYRHIANNGREQVDIIVHGATSLPQNPKGSVPQPYAVIKTKTDDDADKKTGVVSHVSQRPTHSPYWGESVTVNMDGDKAGDEHLVVTVADCQTQKGLVNYTIPVTYLSPFHQYHLELNKPCKGIPSGVKTYATITRKLDRLPKDSSSPNYLGFEVLLRNVQRPIETPVGPLIAVARIVPDYYNYKSDNLSNNPRNAGVVMHSVTFPSSHPSNFLVTEGTTHGHPQVSLPGRPDAQPKWNHPYLFVEKRDKATLFTPGAALVIEYYLASMSMTDQFWRMQSPVAFSAILMDQDMYKQLIEPRASQGLRLEGVPLQGCDMRTLEGKRPTVGMILRLITTENPDTLVSVSNLDDIPAIDLYPSPEAPGYYRSESPDILRVSAAQPDETTLEGMEFGHDARSLRRAPYEMPFPPTPGVIPPSTADTEYDPGYYLQKVKKRPLSPFEDGKFPPYEAMENVLPEYQYIFHDGKPEKQGKKTSPRTANPGPSKRYEADDLEKNSMMLLDHQTREINNYRKATHQMGQDVMSLQQEVADLQNVNSRLRRDLAGFSDSKRIMLESQELENLTRPDMVSRYVTLKQTLSTQTDELKNYKIKLQAVQNELIKKNDQEKNFLKIQQAHSIQQKEIQKLQERVKKMKKLEETCKQQEDMIQKMENVIARHHKDRHKLGDRNKGAQDANEALLQENKLLRTQIDDLRAQLRIGGGNQGNSDDLEKMELLAALEKCNGRIAALEKQLAENSRDWGKERSDYALRLNEAEHGLGRTQGVMFHDFDTYPKAPVGLGASRTKLSPMYR